MSSKMLILGDRWDAVGGPPGLVLATIGGVKIAAYGDVEAAESLIVDGAGVAIRHRLRAGFDYKEFRKYLLDFNGLDGAWFLRHAKCLIPTAGEIPIQYADQYFSLPMAGAYVTIGGPIPAQHLGSPQTWAYAIP